MKFKSGELGFSVHFLYEKRHLLPEPLARPPACISTAWLAVGQQHSTVLSQRDCPTGPALAEIPLHQHTTRLWTLKAADPAKVARSAPSVPQSLREAFSNRSV